MFRLVRYLTAFAAVLVVAGCATESSRSLAVATVPQAQVAYAGARVAVSIGKFDNHSDFMRGVFSDGVDRLGSQAKTALASHLQQSQHFNVLDRENLSEGRQEAQYSGQQQKLKGAQYIITGDVTEFGRKEVGDMQLYGILGRGKSQVAYAKVTINVVNALTSELVYSARGAGEYELSSREVVGFGGTSGYDSTLTGKVLDLALREAVSNLVMALDGGQWSAAGAR
jgi:curli biogenesis system outer membrane secretion channel CsgG